MDDTHDPAPTSPDEPEAALAELAAADPADAPESAERLAAHLTAALDAQPPPGGDTDAGGEGSRT